MKISAKIALLVSVIVAFLLVFVGVFCCSNIFSQQPKKTKDYPVVVSLGDSYSSGEGAPPFYGQEESDFQAKVNNDDWIAHRSTVSWPGKLMVSNGTDQQELKSFKDARWFFKAASGAEIKHLTEVQEIEYNNGKLLSAERVSGARDLPAQLDVFDTLEQGSVDYVTVTIGGNDIGFVDVIKQAAAEIEVLGRTTLSESLQRKLDAFDTAVGQESMKMRLAHAFRTIGEKAGSQAQLIVVGYPTLFDESAPPTLVSASEAKAINEAARELDKKMASLCDELGRDMNQYGFTIKNLHYVSVVYEFSGHEGEYLNGIILGARDQDVDQTKLVSSYSVHPTEAGTSAYARAVQAMLDELEKQRLSD